jgi:hypothetical protein
MTLLLQLIVWSSLALDVQEMVHHMQMLLGVGGQSVHQQQAVRGGHHPYILDPMDQNFNTALNNAVSVVQRWLHHTIMSMTPPQAMTNESNLASPKHERLALFK